MSTAGNVAIVGRPNVGKSTLFNRLIGARVAIVEDSPGVTRDRMYGQAEWDGRRFGVVDTGGIDPSLNTGLPQHIAMQADVAVQEADLVVLVLDGRTGPTPIDHAIAQQLRRSGRPILVVANKIDSPKNDALAYQATELGLGEVIAVSAAHGRGVDDLCDAIVAKVGTLQEPAEPPAGTRLAFVGRPNAGKSTLTNALLGQARVIVDAEPGTTRDAVFIPWNDGTRDWVLIDTAGMRRRKQVVRAHEQLAAIKAIRALERTDIAVLVIDATQGVTDQDKRIANLAFVRGKGVVVLLHKWDLVVQDGPRAKAVLEGTKEALAFLERPAMVKTSVATAKDGTVVLRGAKELLEAGARTAAAQKKRISTSALNQALQRTVDEQPPPLHQGHTVRLYFATQAEADPPLIVISANRGRCLQPAYERFLMRRFRERWGLWGMPIRLVVRGRGRSGGADRPYTPPAEPNVDDVADELS